MKAIVLAGGRGTRLQPLTHTSNKHLIPIANRPMIYRVIKDIVDAGITEVIVNLNVGDTVMPEAIKEMEFPKEVKFHYIEQPEPNGMMYPILLAKDIIDGDDFILHAGDNVLSGGLKKYIDEFNDNDSDAHLLVTKVENPERFGVAVVKDGVMTKTVEKPKKFVSDLAVTGVYIYRGAKIMEAMEGVDPIDPSGTGKKAEYYPPPAHQYIVDNGGKITVTEVTGWWKDTGKPNDLLLANRLVLEKMEEFKQEGKVIDSDIEGGVEIMKGAVVKNSKIRGPVTIGKDAVIEDAYIGPYTAIGDGAEVSNSQIENSIVMRDAKILDVSERIDTSLIGIEAIVETANNKPKAINLFVGDRANVRV